MVCLSTKQKVWKVFVKSSPETKDPLHLQKGVDFLHAFMKGFKYEDALAVVRIDGIYVESFHIMDVKQTLRVRFGPLNMRYQQLRNIVRLSQSWVAVFPYESTSYLNK